MIIEIPINKSKAAKQLILFSLLLLLFVIMVVQPQLFVKGTKYGFVKITGFIGTFLFTIITAILAQKVFNKKPGLIIDNNGFVDNSLGVMFAKVLWKDVTEIKHVQASGENFIVISIKEPEKYIAEERHSLKRKMLELNYTTLKTPINIAAGKLKVDFNELLNMMKRKYEEFGKEIAN
ncbi:hypothetical protein PIECOFPK_00070 [Mycovorax composti]|uniref:Uncharacterized protein n=1 Tax=Mycovorax composti TaxID=2962693 RepID=A0ABZ2EGD5_9BACT